jgi:hypothetical protein
MIKGGFNDRRPHISGLLLFPAVKAGVVSCRFLLDTGADRTLVVPVDYESDGFRYQDFRRFPPADSMGFGGELEGRLVEAKLLLRHADGAYQQIAVEVEIAKPAPAIERLPSILGRDVADLFRLVVDRSVNLVCLDVPGASVNGAWPDEAT